MDVGQLTKKEVQKLRPEENPHDPNIDPMKTLAVPRRDSDVKTLGVSDATLDLNALTTAEDTETGATDSSTDQTIIVTPSAPEPTLVNPAAAQEAAELYSEGLRTIIPPRNISRDPVAGQIQDYQVEKRLGSGAYGVVFRAKQVPLERSVAVKVLRETENISDKRREKLKTEFLREAQFTGKLEHPNIVPIHDIGLTVSPDGESRPFYVMKEIRGISWLDTIREKSRRENLKIFKNVVDAIGFAHEQNILHCDLKPENVMVGEFGEVLVVDWGQSVDLTDPETMRPGGTPAYIAPEMAQFWCDLHLDGLEDSPARKKVGFRSDVYLLGALLFEIVTAEPPHTFAEDLTPYQVIRKAANNEITDYEKHVNDELIQISLACMRLGKRPPIETTGELTVAIREYEDRLSSIELRQRAYQILADAKSNSDYDQYQRARFGFEESLAKWEGNSRAQKGLRDAQVSCAQLALKDQNFDLGIGMLDNPETEQEKTLKESLLTGKSKRDRRKKLVRYLALGLASSIIVGIALNGFMINENYKSLTLRDAAVAEKSKAEQEKAKAEQDKQLAVKEKSKIQAEVFPLRNEVANLQTQIQEFPEKLRTAQENFNVQLNVEQKKFANDMRAKKEEHEQQLASAKTDHEQMLQSQQQEFSAQLKEEKDRLDAKLAKANADHEKETQKLVEQRQDLVGQVADLNESSKLLRYKSSVTDVKQKLQAGDFRESRKLLNNFEDKSPWEVGRLNLLAHREILSIYPSEPLTAISASEDGSTFGLLLQNRIEIRKTESFDRVQLSIPIDGATAIAFSKRGDRIAVGKPANSRLEPGKIWIIDVTNPSDPRQIRSLDAQSQTISKLEFNDQSGQLLSVGKPSRLRKSSNTKGEKELMVWDKSWNPINVKLIVANGQLPKFTSAQFSHDGKQILTTNPDGQARDQAVHVFTQRANGFHWKTTSPATGINCATFENTSATRVVGCAFDKQTNAYSIVTWAIDAGKSSFVSTDNKPVSDGGELRIASQLSSKALSISRYRDELITTGQNRQITLWNWTDKSSTSFRGHSREVDFGFLLPSDGNRKHVLVSASLGNAAEILKTDLSTFEDEVVPTSAGRVSNNDRPSPSTISQSIIDNQIALGNDFGQASVQSKDNTIQWEVSAWKNHLLSDDSVYAQSRGDYIYRFDRGTGNLESVLTNLASEFQDEIVKFEVSKTSNMALIVTDDKKPQFHIWNLAQDRKVRTIDYGAENVFGTGTEKELLALTISPDGQWIIGGKVGVFAWSIETGKRTQLTKPSPEMARSAISAIEFVNEGTRFLVSWKGRIDLFDLDNPEATRRFNTKNVSYNKNEPNLFGVREKADRLYVLARTTAAAGKQSGISLIDLQSQTAVAEFEGARFASFSKNELDVIVVNKSGGNSQQAGKSALQKWNSDANTISSLDLSSWLANRFDNRFKVIEKAYSSNGQITIQTSTKNQNSSSRRDWNTISLNSGHTIGPIKIIAKPSLEFHATTKDRSITLENGNIRLWKLFANSVQPDGIIKGDFRCCAMSKDEKLLVGIPYNSNRAVAFDPKSGKELGVVTAQSKSSISAVALGAKGHRLILGFDDGSVEIFALGDALPKSIENTMVASGPISSISYSADTDVLLAVCEQSGVAYVLKRQEEHWSKIKLAHVDGKKILTGDLDATGIRAITGSADGLLTLWNIETSRVEGNVAEPQKIERELYNFQNQHQSAIRFVKFIENSKGETEVVSSESSTGDNKYLIWKSKPLE